MEFASKSVRLESHRSPCIVVGVYADKSLTPSAQLLDQAGDGAIKAVLASGDLPGKAGQTLLLHKPAGLKCDRLLLVGCGKPDEMKDRTFRQIASSTATALKGLGAREALLALNEIPLLARDDYWKTRQVVEAFGNVFYLYEETKSKKGEDKPALRRVQFLCGEKSACSEVTRAVGHGQAIRDGMDLTRDLANLPGNICTPTYLANRARGLARQYPSVKTTVLGEKEMAGLGMGSLLSVAKGSRQPPKLIVMEYHGLGRSTAAKGAKAAKQKPIVLVGKGLTFDAGGISIKPSAAMDEMKYDMCGGASVFGVIKALAEMQLPINVVGVVPSSENLPDGNANKPGDIVTSMSGQTIEILNTDAEGRLILCDALTYSKKFNPAEVIDIATLTGACIIALGNHASGLMSNDEAVASGLLDAGQESGDRAWQLPMWDEYDEQLKSPFADMANIGGREAGTITAACFLGRYTKDFKWAHLDIAGTAWRSGSNKGATGRPVPLLVQYLLDKAVKGR